MTDILTAACVQMTSGPVIADNLRQAEDLIRQAAASGAKLIATPENTCHMRARSEDKLTSAPAEKDHPGIPLFAKLAEELGVWILAGSMTVKIAADKVANRSFLFSADGKLAATYDKIHLFDVDLPTGERHRESAVVQPGAKTVVTDTPWGGLGMSVCYDVRFAYLYRAMAQRGAKFFSVPAAFTVPTGKGHWEVLVRARAIETGSFVLAPAQCGEHEGGRKTYGHSLIIGPWGEILADGGDKPGIIMASLDMALVDKTRAAVPALRHDRSV